MSAALFAESENARARAKMHHSQKCCDIRSGSSWSLEMNLWIYPAIGTSGCPTTDQKCREQHFYSENSVVNPSSQERYCAYKQSFLSQIQIFIRAADVPLNPLQKRVLANIAHCCMLFLELETFFPYSIVVTLQPYGGSFGGMTQHFLSKRIWRMRGTC